MRHGLPAVPADPGRPRGRRRSGRRRGGDRARPRAAAGRGPDGHPHAPHGRRRGHRAADRLRLTPPPRVLVLTTFDLDEYVFGALRAGAAGFLLKDAPRERLVEAIRVVARRRGAAIAVDHTAADRGLRRPHGPARARGGSARANSHHASAKFSYSWHADCSNGEIAERLVVTEATVKTHVGSLLMKLGLRDRVQAVVFAYEHGIVVAGDPS